VRREEAADPCRPGGDRTPYVCISVSDDGEGMDAETLARCVEPFFTTKGVGRGTGLGLSMVHGMAEQSGGRLRMTSEPGRGTTADILLPCIPSTRAGAGPAPAERGGVGPEAARPLTVLAVDDDSLVLLNTTMMLEELGHRALEATSAREALEILRAGQNVDVLITDQAMPQMTGLQLAAEARRLRCDLPVILATGYAEVPPEPGANVQVLSKPFGLRELARSLASLG
jgi:CheY-like chemotaxis protein